MDKDETYAYFAVVGLGKSSVVTEILGVKPTKEFSEGDPNQFKQMRPYKSMKWRLISRLEKEGAIHDSLESHVADVLTQVEGFKDKLSLLGDTYEAYIQCVSYHNGANLGFGLSRSVVKRIAKLGIGIDFDLYSMDSKPKLRSRNLDQEVTSS